MTYHLRTKNKRGRRSYIPYTIALCVFIFCLILNYTLPHLFSPVAQAIAQPFLQAKRGIGSAFGQVFVTIHSKNELVADVAALQAEVQKNNLALLEHTVLVEENAKLKALLGRIPPKKNELLATVLSTSPISIYDSFLLDVGQSDGAQNGAIVRNEFGTPIGILVEVNNRTSLARLYSSSGQQLQVAIGTSTIHVTAEGRGGSTMQIKLPRDAHVAVGDSITLPGISVEVLGVVEHIETSAADSFENIFFTLPVSLSQTRWVLIDR